MTSTDLEASPPMSLFQHLYQSPPAAAVAPPPPARLPAASTRADNDKQSGPRFKDQMRPAPPLQPATAPSVIREATIPMASALLVPESQIEREHRVQSEMERQLDLERQQLELRQKNIELDRQRLELERQQRRLREKERQEPHQNEQTISKKWWIGGVVVVAVVLVAGVAGFCGSGNCRGSTTSSPAPMATTTTTVASTTTTDAPTIPPVSMPILLPMPAPTARPQPVPMPTQTLRPMPSPVTAQPPQPAPTVAVTPTATTTSSRANSIRSYINSITLTGRSLQYPSSATAEERALLWLIDVDLSTTESNSSSLRQRYALATIWFQTLTGFGDADVAATWTNKDINECDWQGVDCDDAGRLVTSLDLDFFGVGGHIPIDLGLLTALTRLDFFGNALNGTIPSSIGSLTVLTSLDLSYNALNGAIPSSIGSLTDLTDLDLSYNALNGTIPTNITDLTALNYLLLNSNGLAGTMPFCNSVSNRSVIGLVADCGKVSCPCCTHCCPTSRDGIPVYSDC